MHQNELPRRKPLRIRGYDYNDGGCYFLTICTADRQAILSTVALPRTDFHPSQGVPSTSVGRDDPGAPLPTPQTDEPLFGTAAVRLTPLGKMAEAYLRQIPDHYPGVALDHYVIMPNHIHLLLTVTGQRRAESSRPTQRETQRIPRIAAAFKRLTNQAAGRAIWQDSYYDHVVRSEADYLRIWDYIDTNPAHWAEDEYYQERP